MIRDFFNRRIFGEAERDRAIYELNREFDQTGDPLMLTKYLEGRVKPRG